MKMPSKIRGLGIENVLSSIYLQYSFIIYQTVQQSKAIFGHVVPFMKSTIVNKAKKTSER